jgi:hypothetical protein
MVCRFWCVNCQETHFIVGRGCNDDVNKDPCLEIGNKNCTELKELEASGLMIVSPGVGESAAVTESIAEFFAQSPLAGVDLGVERPS